jgi:hypothetical protein
VWVASIADIQRGEKVDADLRQGDRDLRSAILGPAQGACGAALSVWVASIADIQRGEKVDADLRLRARSARRSKVDPRGVR